MPILRIEHQIHEFDAWKSAFDRDPAGRRQSGVRHYRILRPVDDSAYIMVDLDFETIDKAEAFLTVMKEIWQSPQAAMALRGSPRARIVEAVEEESL